VSTKKRKKNLIINKSTFKENNIKDSINLIDSDRQGISNVTKE